MTIVTILNIVLAVAVIGGIVRLLAWAITSSHPNEPVVAVVQPTAYTARARSHRPSAGHAHHHVGEHFEPVTG